MTSVRAFTELLDKFLEELIEVFPEESTLKKYQASYDLMKKTNPRKVVDVFMASVIPYQKQISAADEQFFLNNNIDFLDGLNIKNWWNDDLSDNTKACIWQYIQNLTILGITIVSIPTEMMEGIENLADKMAQGAKSEGGSEDAAPQIDMNALQSMMGNMMGMFGRKN